MRTCPRSCRIKYQPTVTLPVTGLQATLSLSETDSCGLAQTVKTRTPPAHGTLVLDANSVIYIPNTTFRTEDSFTLTVENGRRRDSKRVAVAVSGALCELPATALMLQAEESTPASLHIPARDSCGVAVTLSAHADPIRGSIAISGSSVIYSPDLHYRGNDQFTVKATFGRGPETKLLPVQVTVAQVATEFTGVATSLEPYRTRLTPNEVKHLLRKAAMGGNEALYQVGISGTRADLVEALLNYETPSAVEDAATAKAEAVRDIDGCARPQWFTNSNLNYWLYHMRYGNPLKEEAALQLHDHFAINLDSVKYLWGCASSWGFREHREKLHHFALGSFAGFALSMPDDLAMSYWLDNRLNRYGADRTDSGDASGNYFDVQRTGNQNFGRELMELFTVGKYDPYTGARTYYEPDIELATKAVSGFHSRWNTYVHPDPALPALETGIQGLGGWFGRYAPHNNFGVTTNYDSALAYQGPLSIFQSVPGAAVTREFIPSSFIEYLLYEHPAGSRNIAYSYFSRYAYVRPTEEMTNELATLLRATQYNMKEFLRRVLNSSAMFSTRARGNCINSPTEFMIQFLKAGNFSSESLSALATQRQGLADMNHYLLNAPNVFAWGMCGDSTLGVDNHGEAWLQNQMLLNRYRTVNNILAQQHADGFAVKDLLFPSWNNPTATQVLNRFEEAFNITLNDQERPIVMNYLNRADAPWNPSSTIIVRERLAGLAFIFGTHLKSMLQ